MDKKISVLITAHNAEKTLEKCVDSVLGQTFAADEIWICDNGSEDDTLKRAFQLAEKHPEIHLMAHKHQIDAMCFNRMLDQAEGEWIMMMDASEELRMNALEQMMECAYREHVLMSCESCFYRRNTVLSGMKLMRLLVQNPEMNQLSGKLFHHSLFELLRFEEGKKNSEIGLMAQLMTLSGKAGLTSAVMKKRKWIVFDEDSFEQLERQMSFIMHKYPELSKDCMKVLKKTSLKRKSSLFRKMNLFRI